MSIFFIEDLERLHRKYLRLNIVSIYAANELRKGFCEAIKKPVKKTEQLFRNYTSNKDYRLQDKIAIGI